MTRTLWIAAVMILELTGSAIAETPTKQDMGNAAVLGVGCTSIPFAGTRQACVTANNGLDELEGLKRGVWSGSSLFDLGMRKYANLIIGKIMSVQRINIDEVKKVEDRLKSCTR